MRRKRKNERLRRSSRRKSLHLKHLARVAGALAADLQHLAYLAKWPRGQVGDPSLLELLPFLKRGPRGAFRVDPRFLERWQRLRSLLEEEGYSIKVSSAYRSRRDQEELIRRWERDDPGVITRPAQPGQSAHQFGMAIDVTIDPQDWDRLGELAASVGLEQPDPDEDPVHIEFPNWRAYAPAFNEGRLVPV